MSKVVRGSNVSQVKRKKKKSRLNRKEKAIVGVSITLIVLSIFAVGAMFLMNYSFLRDTTGGGDGLVDEAVKTPDEIKQDVTNFLVIGIADDESERASAALTDVLMVVSVDKKGNAVNILQIPRDTYVHDETSTGKINVLYKNNPETWDYAGIDGLIRMINEMFQIPIDHYVTLTMDGFKSIVDTIGGVTMDVPVDMPLPDNGGILPAGVQTLDGETAITVVRARYVYDDYDIGRMETQRKFMSAFLSQCMKLGLGDMTRLLPTIMSSVSTDMNVSDALSYYKLVQSMDMSNIKAVSLPGGSAYIKPPNYKDKQWIISLYPERVAMILNNSFRPYSDPVPAENLQIVTVLEEPPIQEGEDLGGDSFGDFQN